MYLSWIEILGLITAKHHHRSAESLKRHRRSDSRLYGRGTAPSRSQWPLQHSPRWGQKTGRAAQQTGRERTEPSWHLHFSGHYGLFFISLFSGWYVQVYVAAGTVFGLEAELGDLEECARGISGSSTERELAHLEDQVASAAAQVQQAELQVCSAWTLCSRSLYQSV